jgi:hypothetical protein
MTLTDPTRPKVGGLPKLLSWYSIVPVLSIRPLSSETVDISAQLAVTHNSFSWRSIQRPIISLADFILAYHANPEQVLATEFSWTVPKALPATPPVASSRNLNDLDL